MCGYCVDKIVRTLKTLLSENMDVKGASEVMLNLGCAVAAVVHEPDTLVCTIDR